MARVAVLLSLRTSCVHAQIQTEPMTTAPSKKQAHVPQVLQSRNDTQDLLFLQDYANKLSHTQLTLKEICTSLHRTTLLSGIISAQDRRALQIACCCKQVCKCTVQRTSTHITQAACPEVHSTISLPTRILVNTNAYAIGLVVTSGLAASSLSTAGDLPRCAVSTSISSLLQPRQGTCCWYAMPIQSSYG